MPLLFIAPLRYAVQQNGGTPGPVYVYKAYDDREYATTIMLHGEGIEGGTPVFDDAGVSWQNVGVTHSKANKKFGTSSLLFTGNQNSYLKCGTSPDFGVGTGDFTLECWVYPTKLALTGSGAGATQLTIADNRSAATATGWTLSIAVNTPQWVSSTLHTGLLWYDGTGEANASKAVPYPFQINKWYNIVVSRSKGVLYLIVDGVCIGSRPCTSDYGSTQPMLIGANWASAGAAYAFNGYIDEFRFTQGAARHVPVFDITSGFPTGSADPYWDKVVLHMNMDGLPGGTTFTDTKSHPVTVTGVTTRALPKKFGISSAYFATPGNPFLEIPFVRDFNLQGDFTAEAWVYPIQTAVPNDAQNVGRQVIMSIGVPGMSSFWMMEWSGVGATSKFSSRWVNKANTTVMAELLSTSTFALNVWYHVAVIRSGPTVMLFVNGSLQATSFLAKDFVIDGGFASVHIGNLGYVGGSTRNFVGYVDEVRVTKDVARYFYSMPVAIADVSEVDSKYADLHVVDHDGLTYATHNSAFVDSSPNNLPVTRNGNVSQGTFSPFSNAGWSAYFNGYTYMSLGSVLNLGGDFTIEMWVMPTNLTSTATQMLIGTMGSNGQQDYFGISTNGIGVGIVPTPSVYFGSNPVVILNNVWQHIALVRSGGTFNFYLNGVNVGTYSSSRTIFHLGTTVIGSYYNNSANRFSGYIANLRVTNTVVYSTGFAVPTAIPEAIPGTLLLTCAYNRAKDKSPLNRSMSLYTDCTIRALSPFPVQYEADLHGGSMYMDGAGDYLTIQDNPRMELGNFDFCIEGWVYLTAHSANVGCYLSNSVTGAYSFSVATSGSNIAFWASSNGTTWDLASAKIIGPALVNQWVHFAVVRKGYTYSTYSNGVMGATWQMTPAVKDGGILSLGCNPSGSDPITGYVSDVRLTVDSSVYDPLGSTIVVPVAPAVPVTGTALLLKGTNAALIDVSGHHVIDTGGNSVAFRGFSKWSSGSHLNLAGVSSDYLGFPQSTELLFRTNDFTIEMWVYPRGAQTSGAEILNLSGILGTRIEIGYSSVSQIGLSLDAAWRVTAPVPTINTWSHVAVSRYGNIFRLFINGVQVGSVERVTDISSSASSNFVGNYSSLAYPFRGVIEDLRITRAARYTTTFTPPSAAFSLAGDPYAAYVVMLMKPSGATYKDSFNPVVQERSGNEVSLTHIGTIAQGSFSPYSANGWAIQLGATNTYLSAPHLAAYDLAGGNFTLEVWVKPSFVHATVESRICSMGNHGTTGSLNVVLTTAGAIRVYNGSTILFTSSVLDLNEWTHVALVRASSVTKLFLNGVSDKVASDTTAYGFTTALEIGWNSAYATGASCEFKGFLSNLRLVKGTAIYDADFETPTSKLTAVTGTSLLTFQDNRFKDRSVNNADLAVQGTAILPVVPSSPFNMLQDWTPDLGSSVYVHSASYLKARSMPGFVLDGNFTIEMWVYPNGISHSPNLMCLGRSNSGANGLLIYYSNAAGALRVYQNTSAVLATSNFKANQWNHIAVVRLGGTLKLYVNGSLIGSVANSVTVTPLEENGLCIGAEYASTTFTPLGMFYMADLRIVKGTAIYTTDFEPPVAPLEAVPGTQFLLGNSNFMAVDNTGRNNLFLTGTHTAPYWKKNTAASLAFSGNVSYARTLNNTHPLGGGNFTISMWVYPTSLSAGYKTLVDMRVSTTSVSGLALMISGDQLQLWAGNAMVVQGSGPLILNKWQHIVATRFGTQINLWVDGIMIATAYSSTNYSDQGQVWLGSSVGPTSHFSGFIEDVQIKPGVFEAPKVVLDSMSLMTKSIPSVAAYTNESGLTYDVHGPSVALLMNFNGSDGSTLIVDECGAPVAVGSGATLTTSKSKFGGSCLDARVGFASTSMNLVLNGLHSTAPSTVEGWIFMESYAGLTTSGNQLYSVGTTSDGLWVNSASSVTIVKANGVSVTVTGSAVLTLSAWHHVARVRSGTSIMVFVDGELFGSISDTSTAIDMSSMVMYVGGRGNAAQAGYIDDFRVTIGLARYSGPYAVPAEQFRSLGSHFDIYWDNTTVLLHMDGADNETVFVDERGSIVTPEGSPVIRANSSNFGNSSAYLEGSSSLALTSSGANVNGLEFSVECWFKCMELGAERTLVEKDGTASTFSSYGLFLTAGNKLSGSVGAANGMASRTVVTGTDSIALYQWHHAALVKSAQGLYLYLDGKLQASDLSPVAVVDGGRALRIGYLVGQPASNHFKGYIDEVRVTKGVVRNGASFTPPTLGGYYKPTVDPYWGYTTLAMQFNGDESDTSFSDGRGTLACSTSGTPAIRSAQKKFGVSSMYFDGASRLNLQFNNPALDLGSQDFTFECWIYPTATPLASTMLLSGQTAMTATVADSSWIFVLGAGMSSLAVGSVNYTVTSPWPAINQWSHVAYVRRGTKFATYHNGGQVGSVTLPAGAVVNRGKALLPPALGSGPQFGNQVYTGYVDDLRLTVGVARITGAFVLRDSEIYLGN